MENCLFCAITEGKVPALKVYEDNQSYTVLDIHPAAPGHLLLVPRAHYKTVMEMSETDYARFFLVARALALALLEYGALGVNFLYSIGESAGQRSPHLVLHIVPRYQDDKVGLFMQQQPMDEAQLKQIQQKLMEKIRVLMPKIHQMTVAQQPQQPQEQKPPEPEKPTIIYRRAAGYW